MIKHAILPITIILAFISFFLENKSIFFILFLFYILYFPYHWMSNLGGDTPDTSKDNRNIPDASRDTPVTLSNNRDEQGDLKNNKIKSTFFSFFGMFMFSLFGFLFAETGTYISLVLCFTGVVFTLYGFIISIFIALKQ